MPIYDFIIYKEPQPKHSPRRITTEEYQIEWHRKGILFIKCPDGLMREEDKTNNSFTISSGTIIPWNQLVDKARYDITTLAGEKQFVIRVYNRKSYDALLNGFNEIINEEINANKELLIYIAEHFENRWQKNPTTDEAKEILEILKGLPKGVDDSFCELLLKTWQQRLEEQLLKDMQSDDDRDVMEAICALKDYVKNI